MRSSQLMIRQLLGACVYPWGVQQEDVPAQEGLLIEFMMPHYDGEGQRGRT